MGGSLLSGAQADRRNQQVQGQQQQGITAQQNLIQQMMAGITPGAYHQQAAMATAEGQGQIDSAFAGRGLLGSGAMYAASTNAAAKNYADANANYQRDRQGAYGMALNGQQGIVQQYGQGLNQNPYGGLGASLSGLGTAAGSYFANQMAGQPSGTPMAGFGAAPGVGRYYAIPGYGPG